MRILVTNDDGINAPGLAALCDIAAELAGPDGDIWTIAPAIEQSGTGHCVSYLSPLMFEEIGPKRFHVHGTPADCVLAGLGSIIDGTRPDVVLSGINRGNNSGENVLYSGTVGAAMEAALQGVKAIALSQYMGDANRNRPDEFEAARKHSGRVVKSLLERAPWDEEDYRLFFNVNFPPCAADDVAGVRVVSQGFRTGVKFSATPQRAPNGRDFLWIKGGSQANSAKPGTDVHANHEGYISITPMRADLTARAAMPELETRIQ